MIRSLKEWEEELSTNSRIHCATMITQDWREQNEKLLIYLSFVKDNNSFDGEVGLLHAINSLQISLE